MRSVEDVRAWLAQLKADDLLWHMEDDPLDVNWSRPVTRQKQVALRSQQREAWRICEKAGLDLFELYPKAPCQDCKGTGQRRRTFSPLTLNGFLGRVWEGQWEDMPDWAHDGAAVDWAAALRGENQFFSVAGRLLCFEVKWQPPNVKGGAK